MTAWKPPLILAAAGTLILSGCGTYFGAARPSGTEADGSASGLTSTCMPVARIASVAGDAAYDLTLTNPGSQPVQVSQVAVIFYGQDGSEIGSDDPAQQDFPGDAEPIGSFNTLLIDAGQAVTIEMETAKISGAAGGWSCKFGAWST